MPKYRVTAVQTYEITEEAEIVVEAASEKEAVDMVENMAASDLEWYGIDSEYYDREVTEVVEVEANGWQVVSEEEEEEED